MPLVRLTIHDEASEPIEVHESEIPVLRAQGLLREDPPKSPAPGAPNQTVKNPKEGE